MVCYCEWRFSAEKANEWVNWPDLLFSVPAILALGIAFWRSFFFFRHSQVAGVAVCCDHALGVPGSDTGCIFGMATGADLQRVRKLADFEHICGYDDVLLCPCHQLGRRGVQPAPARTDTLVVRRKRRASLDAAHTHTGAARRPLPPMAMKNLLLFLVRRIENPAAGWVSVDDLNGGACGFSPNCSAHRRGLARDGRQRRGKRAIPLKKCAELFFEYQNPGLYRIRMPLSSLHFLDAFFQQRAELVAAMRSRQERSEVKILFEKIGTWLRERDTPRRTPKTGKSGSWYVDDCQLQMVESGYKFEVSVKAVRM